MNLFRNKYFVSKNLATLEYSYDVFPYTVEMVQCSAKYDNVKDKGHYQIRRAQLNGPRGRKAKKMETTGLLFKWRRGKNGGDDRYPKGGGVEEGANKSDESSTK